MGPLSKKMKDHRLISNHNNQIQWWMFFWEQGFKNKRSDMEIEICEGIFKSV